MKWRLITELLIIALVVSNILELVFCLKIRKDSSLYASNTRMSLPSGYLTDHRFATAGPAPCYLVRLSSDNCRFCRLDKAEYARLVEQAEKTRCRVIILAPQLGQTNEYGAGSDAMQFQFIDMSFGRELNPFITPQTLLLDRGGRIVWDREGSIDADSLSSGLRAIAKLK